MQLSITDRHKCLSEEARTFTQRRLLFALSRFAPKIHHVSVVLADTNGPRGGIDKLCKISVKMRRLGEISISSEDAELTTCIARAADRIGRAVARKIERNRTIDRRGPFVA